jgi:hypothetical protein
MFKDLTGKKFERLTILERVPNQGAGRAAHWRCKCDCGNEVIVRTDCFTRKDPYKTKSCGCLNTEVLKKNATKHGHSTDDRGKTPTYGSWAGMIQRCTNPNNPQFRDYGGRGIAVCERWLDFRNFLDDMGERPNGLTIERLRNSEGYGPDNCKWADSIEQNNNTRRNVLVKYKGVIDTLPNWCRKLSLVQNKVRKRLDRGWAPERAFECDSQKEKACL